MFLVIIKTIQKIIFNKKKASKIFILIKVPENSFKQKIRKPFYKKSTNLLFFF